MLPRVMVTGAAGYLGSRLADALSDMAGVVRLVRPGQEGAAGAHRARIARLDDRAGLAQVLREVRPDHVLHAAGRVAGDPDALMRDNVETTRKLAAAILEATPATILTVLGSAAEYGPARDDSPIGEEHPCLPVSAYGRSKLAATEVVTELRDRGLRVNVVRPFNLLDAPLSPAQVLGAFVTRARQVRDAPPPRIVPMGPLDGVRDFLAVADLAALVRALVTTGREGAIVNACSGRGRSARELITYMNALSGERFTVEEAAGSGSSGVVIGDPRLFLKTAGLSSPSPIEPILEKAWRLAMAAP